MTGILFIARLGSTRLTNKHLIVASGKTLIEWLVARYAHEFENEIALNKIKLILATSNNPENKKFELALDALPVSVFYGNEDNIPLRQVECAEEHKLSNIISIDGDDILCSTNAAREVYNLLSNGAGGWIKTTGLPFGMNVIGYSYEFLKRKVIQPSNKLETGWDRIFDKESEREIVLGNYSGNKDLRFTLDYELDAEFFKTVILNLGSKIISLSDKELINIVLNEQFFEINKSLHEQYWLNFNKQKNAEA